MQESSTIDPILQCPVYELQTTENTRWYRVNPISTIDSYPKVHNCRSTCTSELHDALNNQYLKNEFFFIPQFEGKVIEDILTILKFLIFF